MIVWMRKRRGITIVELAIVVAIVALLTTLMIPNLGRWLSHHRVKTAARDLANHFHRARYQAIQGNQRCVVRFDATNVDGRLYDYIVFLDRNGDYLHNANDIFVGGVLIADYGSGVAGNPYPPGFGNAGGAPCLSFNTRGFPESGTAPLTAAIRTRFRNSRNEIYFVDIDPLGVVTMGKL